jgi:hypothetical protein
MIRTERTPDALMLPASVRSGARMADRVDSVCTLAEAILGLDRPAGKTALIRRQPHDRLFVTGDHADTILFPTNHPRSGQPRYRWVAQADGSEWGYLAEEAK